MRTYDLDKVLFDGASLTGRSGINLDELGTIKSDNSMISWVLDGVSPIIFSRKHAFKFRSFQRAGRVLNSLLRKEKWQNLEESFANVARHIRAQAFRDLFLSGPFFLRPLFSCGIVKIDVISGCVDVALYGDCMVVLKRNGLFEIVQYSELEDYKVRLNEFFSLVESAFPSALSSYIKKLVFAKRRAQQIWLGRSRIFSVRKDFGPAVSQRFDIQGLENIYIMSDGVTWFCKDSEDKLRQLVTSIERMGANDTLMELRSKEASNAGFGKYDDMTLISIEL